MVRTRIAPSPTGSPHVGTAYQALFDYVIAKKFGGEFILRIEDTDRKRLVKGAEEEVIAALKWLGLDFDQGPIRQSERLELYQKYARKLVELGAAYEDGGAIRQRIPKGGETRFVDEVRGEISFENKNLDESVLLKSDDYPTYHLAVVVDDHEMGITHVIRGEEWIPSAPKHILIYQALGWDLPKFIHLPLLRSSERAKLGKRFGDASISWFKNEGILPQSLLNYLALMAWTHPEEKEIFSVGEMMKKFDVKGLNKAAPVFDLEKLKWMNGVYIRSLNVDELNKELRIKNKGLWKVDEEYLKKIIPLVQERMKTLKEFEELTTFFFGELRIKNEELRELLVQKGRTDDETAVVLKSINNQLSAISNSDWKHEEIEKVCRAFVKENPDWNVKDLFMTLRIALTGSKVSPPLFETMEALGRQTTLSRLQNAADLR